MIYDIASFVEVTDDAQTLTLPQYAVRLTYTDGRVRIYNYRSEQAARNITEYHRQIMAREDWRVATAEVVVREVAVSLGEWKTYSVEEGEGK